MLKTHICHIRQKLGLDTGRGSRLKAVFGVGYCLQKQLALVDPPARPAPLDTLPAAA